MMMTLQQAFDLLGGAATLVGDADTPIERVHSDSRSLQRGDLFVALRGDSFDGHQFLAQAKAAGAAAALAERGIADAGLPGLQVADSLAALQQLAAAWRRSLPVALIAVAGSNGKTTVTQMIAAILRAWLGPAAFATEGNLNNHIGVPLTLLRLRREPVGVVELGTNHPGEIAALARLVAPQVGVINNTQREHQEFLHGLDAVALENGQLIDALADGGALVIPAADAGTAAWLARAAALGIGRVRRFALDGDGAGDADAAAEVRGQAQWADGGWRLQVSAPEGRLETTLAIAGRHNARNGVAAAAAALAAGAPTAAVARGLAAFTPVKGRSRSLGLDWQGRRATLVDDSYNANPDSVLAAIDVLAELPGPRWLLLGDMAEVGREGPAFHAEVGRHAAARGLDAVWTFGTLSAEAGRQCRGRHFDDIDALVAALPGGPAAAAILVKGSRSMRMERVVQALQATAAEGGHAA
ncbi:MAG: UDP-N-acetylmuramoyl-tripeptide--D-alanyl-D-alanine ligase [Proteobacteria bacterium]|nr:UDP-N-acetylmuramoyl-tripeptide--D-alanyl-D-alanine ligase [Pseudomonadota bacterium]